MYLRVVGSSPGDRWVTFSKMWFNRMWVAALVTEGAGAAVGEWQRPVLQRRVREEFIDREIKVGSQKNRAARIQSLKLSGFEDEVKENLKPEIKAQ